MICRRFVPGLLLVCLFVQTGWGGVPAEPELKTVPGGSVQYYLSLPKGWSPKSTWPIVVTIEGSGHDFLRNCRGFIQARGDGPFILVTPLVTSNGNDPADEKAVLAIVQELQKTCAGRPKFFITGFSAGGHVTWQLIFHHPDLLAGAAPAAGAFRGRNIAGISTAAERVHLPICGFQGDKDSYLKYLGPQWLEVEQLARKNGYQNISHIMVPGAAHQPFAKEVLNFFSTVLAK